MSTILKNKAKIAVVVSLILVYIVMLFQSQDNDMFFEIVSGRDLLSGNFKTASHLNNFPMLVQQWLYSVTLAIFDKLGYTGHVLVVFLQNVILWVLSGVFLYRKTKNKYVSIVMPLFLTVAYYEYMVNIRPQIITMILIVAELLVLDIYYEKRQTKYLFAVIPILLLAANFHQSIFLYHIFIIIPFYITERKKIDWKLVLVTPLYVACSLCTPYFIDGSLYIFKSYLSNTFEYVKILELEPLKLTTFSGIKVIAIVVITTVLLYKRKADKFTCFYVYSTALLTISAIRHVSIMYFAALYVASKIDYNKINDYIRYGVSLVSALLIFALLPNVGDMRYTYYGDLKDQIDDKNATIFNTAMGPGGYLEYYGFTKVEYDIRAEAFAESICGSETKLKDYVKVKSGYTISDRVDDAVQTPDNEIYEIIEKYDYLLTDQNDYVLRLIDDRWTKVYTTSTYTVWKRN